MNTDKVAAAQHLLYSVHGCMRQIEFIFCTEFDVVAKCLYQKNVAKLNSLKVRVGFEKQDFFVGGTVHSLVLLD